MNTFILSYNPLETKLSAGQLTTFIKENRKVFQWYQPFLGTFVLKSNEFPATLIESFRGAFDGAPFILALTNPYGVGGAQDQTIWDWFNSGIMPSIAPPLPSKALF